jgi:hypothetical protein
MNCNVFMLGRFASKKVILEDLYEEISNVITIEQFEELYDFATKDKPYDSLIIDCSGEEKRFYKNYETELIIPSTDDPKNKHLAIASPDFSVKNNIPIK